MTNATQGAAGKVAVVGSGFIGQSWAIVFARAGYDVALFDANPGQVGKALDYIAGMLPDLAAADLLLGKTAADVGARITSAPTLADALAGAIYVQENTPEQLDIKRAVFAEMDALAGPDTILASSTSALVPSSFCGDLPGAARCVVAHPVNPPHLIPAVEIVPSPATAPDTVAKVEALMHAVEQSVVVMKKELDGFIVNRLQGALLHEAFRIFAEGYADTESIDVCIRDGLGLRWSFMGPFETIDLNAVGGVRDYIERYSPFYHRLWDTTGGTDMPDWNAVRHAVEAERNSRLGRDDLGQRQAWRDRELIALLSARRARRTS